MLPLPEGQRQQIPEHFFTWIKVGSFQADFAYLLDPLSGVYILFITGVGLLIHIYATGYMHGDPGYYRFFAYLNLFMFMMLTLVLADNLLLLFVGWEGVGLCSYLLIGYYIKRDVAGDAAKKAFIVNRIGDFGFVLGHVPGLHHLRHDQLRREDYQRAGGSEFPRAGRVAPAVAARRSS